MNVSSQHPAGASSLRDERAFALTRESPFLAWPRKGNPKEGHPGSSPSGHPCPEGSCSAAAGRRMHIHVHAPTGRIHAASLRAFRTHRSPPLRGPGKTKKRAPCAQKQGQGPCAPPRSPECGSDLWSDALCLALRGCAEKASDPRSDPQTLSYSRMRGHVLVAQLDRAFAS